MSLPTGAAARRVSPTLPPGLVPALGAAALILVLLLPAAGAGATTSTGAAPPSGSVWVAPTPSHVPLDPSAEWRQAFLDRAWWLDWSRDADGDRIDDYLELLTANDALLLRAAGRSDVRVFVDFAGTPSDVDRARLDAAHTPAGSPPAALHPTPRLIALSLDLGTPGSGELQASFDALLAWPGVVMLEAVPDVQTHLAEANAYHGTAAIREQAGLSGAGVTVAVIDTGIDGAHVGLDDQDDDNETWDPKIVAGYDAILTPEDRSGNATAIDDEAHGSHVAGIVGGTGAPDFEHIGVAPRANLIMVRACCGDPVPLQGDDAELVITGLEWIIETKDRYGTDIVTMSLGEQYFDDAHVDNDGSSAWSRTVDAMVLDHDLFVASSQGNEGITVGARNTVDVPADAFFATAVGSLDKDGTLAGYSSRGTTSDGRTKPEVSAIGSDVMSVSGNSGDGYRSLSGTSMATPFVAGLAALTLEAHPELSATDLRSRLMATADGAIWATLNPADGRNSPYPSDLNTPNNDFGWGRIQSDQLMTAAGSGARPLDLDLVLHPVHLPDGTVPRPGARLAVTTGDVLAGNADSSPTNGTPTMLEWTVHVEDDWGGNSSPSWVPAAGDVGPGGWVLRVPAGWSGNVSVHLRAQTMNSDPLSSSTVAGPPMWLHLSVTDTGHGAAHGDAGSAVVSWIVLIVAVVVTVVIAQRAGSSLSGD